MVPVVARLDTWLPFTYSRSVAPSYVSARCDQRFTGTDPSRVGMYGAAVEHTPASG